MTPTVDDQHAGHVKTLMARFTSAGYTCWHPYKRAEWKREGSGFNNMEKRNFEISLQYICGGFDFEAHRPGSKVIYVRLQDTVTGSRDELKDIMGSCIVPDMDSIHCVALVVGRLPRNEYHIYFWNENHGWAQAGKSYRDSATWALDLERILYVAGAIPDEPKPHGQARLSGGEDPWS